MVGMVFLVSLAFIYFFTSLWNCQDFKKRIKNKTNKIPKDDNKVLKSNEAGSLKSKNWTNEVKFYDEHRQEWGTDAGEVGSNWKHTCGVQNHITYYLY